MKQRGSTPNRRVVVTGLGAITPFGMGFDALRSGIREGRTALSRAGSALPGAEDCTVGVIRDFTPFRAAFPEMRPPLPVSITKMALLAAHDALADSGLPLDAPR